MGVQRYVAAHRLRPEESAVFSVSRNIGAESELPDSGLSLSSSHMNETPFPSNGDSCVEFVSVTLVTHNILGALLASLATPTFCPRRCWQPSRLSHPSKARWDHQRESLP